MVVKARMMDGSVVEVDVKEVRRTHDDPDASEEMMFGVVERRILGRGPWALKLPTVDEDGPGFVVGDKVVAYWVEG